VIREGRLVGHALIHLGESYACSCGIPFASLREGARLQMRGHRVNLRMAPFNEIVAMLPTDECIPWGGKLNHSGYAMASRTRAHCFIYEMVCGPIPSGLHIDHLCRRRDCVNPAHLEPVTNNENNARGFMAREGYDPREHCRRGHPRTPENTYWMPKPNTRDCVACRRIREIEARDRRRNAAA